MMYSKDGSSYTVFLHSERRPEDLITPAFSADTADRLFPMEVGTIETFRITQSHEPIEVPVINQLWSAGCKTNEGVHNKLRPTRGAKKARAKKANASRRRNRK